MLDTTQSIISFDYSSPEVAEIARNLRTLYGTPEGAVPLDRNIGLNTEFVGYPLDVAQNMIALEIIEKTEIYEPRVIVKEVSFTSTVEGILIPNILVTKADSIDNNDEEGDE